MNVHGEVFANISLKGTVNVFSSDFPIPSHSQCFGRDQAKFKTVVNRHFRTGGSLEIPPTVPLRKLDTSKVIMQGKIIAVAYTLLWVEFASEFV